MSRSFASCTARVGKSSATSPLAPTSTSSPDSKSFQASDYGNPLNGWPGEWWLNTKSANVVNVDGFSNDTGFTLTKADAVDCLKFLAKAAHSRGMAMGLKNAGDIIPQIVGQRDFAVNEQCNAYEECKATRPFITAGKPVFHIEYPDGAPNVDESTKSSICDDPTAKGFSTLLKNMNLDEWGEAYLAS